MKVLGLILSSCFLCLHEAHGQLPVNGNEKPGLCTAGLVEEQVLEASTWSSSPQIDFSESSLGVHL